LSAGTGITRSIPTEVLVLCIDYFMLIPAVVRLS